MPFILESCCWIFENGLVENGSDPDFVKYATKVTLDVLQETITDKIKNLPDSKQSEKTLLMDYFIRLLPASDNFEMFKQLGTSSFADSLNCSINKI